MSNETFEDLIDELINLDSAKEVVPSQKVKSRRGGRRAKEVTVRRAKKIKDLAKTMILRIVELEREDQDMWIDRYRLLDDNKIDITFDSDGYDKSYDKKDFKVQVIPPFIRGYIIALGYQRCPRLVFRYHGSFVRFPAAEQAFRIFRMLFQIPKRVDLVRYKWNPTIFIEEMEIWNAISQHFETTNIKIEVSSDSIITKKPEKNEKTE